MSKYKVLLTDYAWDDLEIERRLLKEIDAELIVAEKSDPAALAESARNNRIHAIMTTWADVPEEVILASPDCQIVSRLGIGLDNIDIECCSQRNIPVTNVPDYCLDEVAEHALALLMCMARKIAFYHLETKRKHYDRQAGPQLRRLRGQTLGIVGLGNIGSTLAERAGALGLHVIASSRTKIEIPQVDYCELKDLLRKSDYVSLHLPLTQETTNIIAAEELSLMKPTAYLINTSRGKLVDHHALAAALQADQIAGAALDVQEIEPPDLSQPPYNDPRVIVTPHAAFLSVESLEKLRTDATRQVVTRLQRNLPDNIANRESIRSL